MSSASRSTTGIDIVSDGEYSKVSYVTYVEGTPDRLRRSASQSDGSPARHARSFQITNAAARAPSSSRPTTARSACAIREAVRRDVATFKAAAAAAAPGGMFMTAASPGVIDTFMPSTYYATDREYLEALGAAMFDEYRAIVEAGFVLQIDCPDLAMSRTMRFADLSDAEFIDTRAHAPRRAGERPRAACRAERMRLHLCWGNFEGPHNHDIPLERHHRHGPGDAASAAVVRGRQPAPRARVEGLQAACACRST